MLDLLTTNGEAGLVAAVLGLLLHTADSEYLTCAAACRDWVARAKALLETGGAKVAELDWLLGNAGQFAWGPAETCGDEVAALLPRLREAKTWVAQVPAQLPKKICQRDFLLLGTSTLPEDGWQHHGCQLLLRGSARFWLEALDLLIDGQQHHGHCMPLKCGLFYGVQKPLEWVGQQQDWE
jgi:hypothetical protein